jgi:hypothetical protein
VIADWIAPRGDVSILRRYARRQQGVARAAGPQR